MEKIQLSNAIKKAVKKHARGSFYRLNVKGADCYCFTLYRRKDGKIDFQGGWDYLKHIVDTTAEFIYILETDIFIYNE